MKNLPEIVISEDKTCRVQYPLDQFDAVYANGIRHVVMSGLTPEQATELKDWLIQAYERGVREAMFYLRSSFDRLLQTEEQEIVKKLVRS